MIINNDTVPCEICRDLEIVCIDIHSKKMFDLQMMRPLLSVRRLAVKKLDPEEKRRIGHFGLKGGFSVTT